MKNFSITTRVLAADPAVSVVEISKLKADGSRDRRWQKDFNNVLIQSFPTNQPEQVEKIAARMIAIFG